MPRGKADERVDDLLAMVRANPGLDTRGYWEMAASQNFWDEEWNDKAIYQAQIQDLRTLMHRITDDLGQRLVHSIKARNDETGRVQRYYVHEAAMDADEYRAVLEELRGTITRACAELVELARRYQQRHGQRFPISEPIQDLARQYIPTKEASQRGPTRIEGVA